MKNAPVRHRIEQGAYLLVKGLLRALPHEGARQAGRLLGGLAGRLLGERRRRARENLRQAFPERSEEEIDAVLQESFRHLGLAFCDPLSAVRFDAVEFCRRLTLEGFGNLQEAEAHGKGVFVMSAHLGCWEAAAHTVGLYQGPLDVVGRPLDNPYLDRDLVHMRTRFGNRVLDKRGAARGMLKVLKAGGRVGILIDQRSPDADAIQVPFFGRPARTTAALARMSLRTGAPVVPLFGYPEPEGRYRVVYRQAIHPPAGPEGARDPQIVSDLTARYLAIVEAEIRPRPELWMWLHRRWRP